MNTGIIRMLNLETSLRSRVGFLKDVKAMHSINSASNSLRAALVLLTMILVAIVPDSVSAKEWCKMINTSDFTILSEERSPSGSRTAIVQTRAAETFGATQVLVDFNDRGAGNAFLVHIPFAPIIVRWLDESSLEVQYPYLLGELKVDKLFIHERVMSRGEYVNIHLKTHQECELFVKDLVEKYNYKTR